MGLNPAVRGLLYIYINIETNISDILMQTCFLRFKKFYFYFLILIIIA